MFPLFPEDRNWNWHGLHTTRDPKKNFIKQYKVSFRAIPKGGKKIEWERVVTGVGRTGQGEGGVQVYLPTVFNYIIVIIINC